MKIGSAENLIEINEIERAPKGAPNESDLRVVVEVGLGEFSGRYDSIWLEEPVLRKFISCLERLENALSGSVKLESCSPEEFVLTLRSRDALGHFAVEVSLCRNRYFGGSSWPTRISGGFEIEASQVRTMLNDFKELHRPSV
jgi:hypothetical protein